MSWPNPWNHNPIFTRMRLSKPIAELERKADKARRKKGKIWTVEEIDCAIANGKKLARWFVERGKKA